MYVRPTKLQEYAMTNSISDQDKTLTPKPGVTSQTADGAAADGASKTKTTQPKQRTSDEIGGPKGPEPTRFGDWEQKGRCSDF